MTDLQNLIDAVKRRGADIAPTYSEYLQLALALATDCGEAGRSAFHELCSLSPKYRQADADKMYTRVLRDGRGEVHLGTVFHLARLAGVEVEEELANLQNLQPPLTHTRVREENFALPCFPVYPWPPFLQQVVDCGDSPAQRDILLLGAITVFGATLNRLVRKPISASRAFGTISNLQSSYNT